jgi:diguanylate cyclase (GGDEF)-like protein
MAGSPAGSPDIPRRIVVTVIAGCCLAMALVWVRGRWPSAAHSTVFTVIATACLTAACLAMADPHAGILLATAFAVLGGYVALFHSVRHLLFVVTVATATAAALSARLAETSGPVWAISALVFVVMPITTVPSVCHLVVGLIDMEPLGADIEPLTGLLNRAAFYRATSHVVARSRDDDRQLVIVDINIDNLRLMYDTDGAAAGDRARVAVAQTLRETTRHNAFVGHIGHDEFVIADTFPSTDSFPLVERVRGAIATTPPRLTASIGVVSTPLRGLASCPPEELLDELIAAATGAMCEARRAGGNQARYVVCANPVAAQTRRAIGDVDG